MKKILPVAAVLFGCAVSVLSLLPFAVYGIFNVGVWGTFLFGMTVALLPLLKKLLSRQKAGRVVFAVFSSLLAAGSAFLIVMLCVIASYPTKAADHATVVVPGCQVKSYGPSLMMTYRLKAAKAYLDSHPDACCVLTGGKGADEPISEAACMRNWLTDHGIDEARLFCEEKSSDTDENFRFAADVIAQNGLSRDVVVVTDEFHEHRSCLCAKRYGLSPAAFPSHSPWILQQSYWIREVFGLLKFTILEGGNRS